MINNLLVYYFTGTGNSLRVAQWMVELARGRGLAAKAVAVDAAVPVEELTGVGQLVGVVGPTHGFTAPWWMIRFALRLPRAHGEAAFTLFNRAGMQFGQVAVPGLEGTAAYLIALLLWLKGYRVRGATGMDMPSNWTVIHPSLSQASVAAIIARAKPRVEGFLGQMLDGRTAFRSLLPLLLGILLIPVSLAYLLMGRFFLSKLFFASGRCNGCGVCARSCPVGGD